MSQLSPAESIVTAVDAAIGELMERRSSQLAGQSAHAAELMTPLREMTRGGKRTRAIATWWGFEIAAGLAPADSAPADSAPADSVPGRGIAGVAASVELFHAAALIHDDIIDNSATRRGLPAVHTEFAGLHTRLGAAGPAARFGANAAIIAGDLLVSLSEQLFTDSGLPRLPDPAVRRAHDDFRQDVMLGQYLDIRLQDAPATPEQIATSAVEVLTLKSAKYSVEQPFVLGAALGGADPTLLAGLSAFGLPLGRAFQMRDDYLGVFGDPQVTGKPAGGDLYEGKKTVLVGLTLQALAAADARWFMDHLGHRDLTDAQVERMKELITGSGALETFEAQIAAESALARNALDGLGLAPDDRALLSAYAERLVNRAL